MMRREQPRQEGVKTTTLFAIAGAVVGAALGSAATLLLLSVVPEVVGIAPAIILGFLGGVGGAAYGIVVGTQLGADECCDPPIAVPVNASSLGEEQPSCTMAQSLERSSANFQERIARSHLGSHKGRE